MKMARGSTSTSSIKNMFTSSDDLKTIPDKGLPFHKQSFKFGNLFVMFKVTFPDSVKVAKVPSLL